MSRLRIFALVAFTIVGCQAKEEPKQADPKQPEPKQEAPQVEIKPPQKSVVEPNFTSTKSRFKVWLPAEPKEEIEGPEGNYVWTEHNDVHYSIQEYRYKDPLPRDEEVDLTNAKNFVAAFAEKGFKATTEPKQSWKHGDDLAVVLEGLLEDEVTKKTSKCVYQYVFVGDRGFQMQVLGEKSLADNEDVKKFLSSFRTFK